MKSNSNFSAKSEKQKGENRPAACSRPQVPPERTRIRKIPNRKERTTVKKSPYLSPSLLVERLQSEDLLTTSVSDFKSPYSLESAGFGDSVDLSGEIYD